MKTRAAVNKNTVLVSELTVKTKAKAIVVLSSNISGPSQMGACAGEKEEANSDEDNFQEAKGQHPVSSKQKVGKTLLDFIEFDDTAELNINDTAEITINKHVVTKLFPDHSSSIIHEADISNVLDKTSYPYTLEGCKIVIDELRLAKNSLYLTNTENEHFLSCFQSDALSAQHHLDQKHRKREH